MHGKRYVMVAALIGCALFALGCKRSTVAAAHHPAKVDSTDVKGIMRVTLGERAAERIGLKTAQIRADKMGNATRSTMPYGALLYDTKGDTWTFTSPQPLVFVRQQVVVDDIEGDRVILAEGPPAGTVVVTVGATELMGAEHKYGH